MGWGGGEGGGNVILGMTWCRIGGSIAVDMFVKLSLCIVTVTGGRASKGSMIVCVVALSGTSLTDLMRSFSTLTVLMLVGVLIVSVPCV